MHIRARDNKYPTLTLVAGAGILLSGIVEVYVGTAEYRLWTIVLGAALCTYVPWNLYQWFVITGRLNKRTWIDRSALVAALLAFAVVILAVVGSMLHLSFTFLPGVDSRVTPAELVEHPFLYNGQPVQTFGNVLSGDGRCMLQITGAARETSQVGHSATDGIWLLSGNALCHAQDADSVHASVSGVYNVFDATRRHALTRMIMPASIRSVDTAATMY